MNSLESLVQDTVDHDGSLDSTIKRALESVRNHLGMEIAYVSEFVGDQSVYREVDAPGLEDLIKPGDSRPTDEVYCKHILEGNLPEMIPDVSAEPLACSLPVTKEVPIGSHVSVPIRLPDGRVYGMFCCLSTKPDPSLNERDLEIMRAFAELATHQVSRDVVTRQEEKKKRREIQTVIRQQDFTQVFQPLWDFSGPQIVGFECLTRFSAEPARTPDVWFGAAAKVGLGPALELAVIKAILKASSTLRDRVYVSLNASPETILSEGFAEAMSGADASEFVLEVTEHARVEDYPALQEAIKPFREKGLRLAIDDAGAGYASLQHIVQLKPDIIKLDMSLTRNVDTDPALRALASALIFFSRETGCQILAEGIETREELRTLQTLGINKGQGYLIGRPVSLELAMELLGAEKPLERILSVRAS